MRRANAAFNLALLRNALLALIPSGLPFLDAPFDYCHARPAAASKPLHSRPSDQ